MVAASSASVYGLAEEFPTAERHHHHNNDTFYGAAKSFNEGMLRSFRAMYGLDYVALRYFNVYGPRMDVHGLYTEVLVRWMERIADGQPPLIFGDGQQTMDFVFTTDIARANVLAATSDVTEGVYNIASGEETSLLELAEALLRAMDSDLGVEHGPERAVNGVTRRLADITAAASVTWASTREVGLEDGLRELVDWWRAAARRRRGGHGRRVTSMSRINVMQPWLGEEEVARRHRGHRVRLGGPGPPGRRVRGGVRRAHAGRARRGGVELHDRAAPGPGRRRASAPATTSSCRRSRSSPRPTRPCTSARARCSPTSTPTTGNVTADTVEAALTPPTRAVIAVDQGGVPVDLDAIRELCDPLGIVVIEDAACGAGSTVCAGGPSARGADIAAWSFHPRKIVTTGEGGMLTTVRAGLGASGPAACASTR